MTAHQYPFLKHARVSVRAAITAQLNEYLSVYGNERTLLTPLLSQIDVSEDVCVRNARPGHVTACCVATRGSDVLVVFHPIIQRWLPPGGHIEEGELPQEAALRELFEETGFVGRIIGDLDGGPIPIDIDIHSVPENPAKKENEHLHYDFRYLVSLDPNASPSKGELMACWKSRGVLSDQTMQRLNEKLKHI